MAVHEFDRARGGVIESLSGACRRLIGRAGTSIRVVRLALVGALASLLVLGCQSRQTSTQSGADVQLPDQEARDFTLTESLEGRKNWTLWASYAAMYSGRQSG